jgi:predicted membrane protein
MILITLGAFFLLNNLHVLRFHEIAQYWPVVLIAGGLAKLLDTDSQSGRLSGGVLLGVGALLLARNLGFVLFNLRDLWPLLLIGAGILMLIHRVWEPGTTRRFDSDIAQPASVDCLNAHVLFSGVKRRIRSQNFEGGEIGATFGGVEIDLTEADFPGPSVTLEIDAVMGGVELRIPRHWRAEVHGTGIFGAFNDDTVRPDPERYPAPKILIVKGSAVFGGVEVKN